MKLCWIFFVILLNMLGGTLTFSIKNDMRLMNRLDESNSNSFENANHYRRKRYLGLNKRFKINRQYQECVGPGDAKGHCKHLIFCPIDAVKDPKNILDYLCVIEKTHVGLCCPDDIALSGSVGSQIILDLPGGGNDYDDQDNTTGCGIPIQGNPNSNKSFGQQWPWMVSIYKPQQGKFVLGEQFCGGSLITEYHVLTAAHCTAPYTPDQIRVRLGEYNFEQSNETRHVDYTIESMTEHEDYGKATYASDISIIKMKKPTTFNSYIWPICLPPIDRSFINEIAIVAGWGRKYYGGPVNNVLHHVAVPIWPPEMCQKNMLQRITEDNLCAAGYDGDKDSCQGDSGGPLMFQLENGRWVAVGIVSWGIGCGNKNSPGIYTKVSSYIPWIIQHTIAK